MSLPNAANPRELVARESRERAWNVSFCRTITVRAERGPDTRHQRPRCGCSLLHYPFHYDICL